MEVEGKRSHSHTINSQLTFSSLMSRRVVLRLCTTPEGYWNMPRSTHSAFCTNIFPTSPPWLMASLLSSLFSPPVSLNCTLLSPASHWHWGNVLFSQCYCQTAHTQYGNWFSTELWTCSTDQRNPSFVQTPGSWAIFSLKIKNKIFLTFVEYFSSTAVLTPAWMDQSVSIGMLHC